MKTLEELYPGCGSQDLIKSIKINSKEIEEGDLFVCTMGVTADRHDYIDDAIKHGCKSFIVSKDIKRDGVNIIKVPDTNRELPYLCQKFYDYPDKKLKMFAVTGTDGKTSTATIVQTLIGSDLCGYIGTNGRSCAKFKGDNPNTTPDAHLLFMYLDEFVKYGCKYAIMEASSEAFFRGRLQANMYDITGYTNVTSEHLNIHGSFENYLECKKQLFKQTKKEGFCILNKDDEYFEDMKSACNGQVLTYGKDKSNDLQIVSYDVYPDHTDIVFKYKEKELKINSKDIEMVSTLEGQEFANNIGAKFLETSAKEKAPGLEEFITNLVEQYSKKFFLEQKTEPIQLNVNQANRKKKKCC